MNFLAHAYLSFNQPEILVGNLMSDFVKGNHKFSFSIGIQKGIELHRKIDEFTDNHLATKNAKKIFNPEVGLYAGAFTDVAFDYFLANDTNEFANDAALSNFAIDTYKTLDRFATIFPEKFGKAFVSMKKNNWLYHYKINFGIEKSFEGLTNRAKYINKTHNAFSVFLENKKQLENSYNIFFKDVKQFAKQQLLMNG